LIEGLSAIFKESQVFCIKKLDILVYILLSESGLSSQPTTGQTVASLLRVAKDCRHKECVHEKLE
jgi:hypothetical protein